ncbi:MAG: hypothetical protein D6791_05875 [Chloroflexi bacterium]|nr:MAG: hypothetical protein D6791_05875 [Chloroflexota bacterium]
MSEGPLERLEAWLLWLLVTGISWPLGLVIAFVAATRAGQMLPRTAGLALGIAIGGAVVGLAQWLILDLEVRGIGSWMLASAIGWTIGLTAAAPVAGMTHLLIGKAVSGALGGCVFGLAQWMALHHSMKQRNQWLAFMVAGWTVSLTLGMTLLGNAGSPVPNSSLLNLALAGAVGWLLIGMLAILVIVLLLPRLEKKDTESDVKWWPPL